MSRNYIPGIDDDYKFTRPEFAQFLGISPNALRMKMRRGFFGDCYVIRNGKYLFKRPRPKQDVRPPQDHLNSSTNDPLNTKRVRNRGNHKEGNTSNYNNDAFKMHNEMKMLNKINGKFKSEEHKRRFEQLNDAVLQKIDADIKADAVKEIKRSSSRNSGGLIYGGMSSVPGPSKYGSMLNATGIKEQQRKEHAKLNRIEDNKSKTKYLQKLDYEGQSYTSKIPDFFDGNNNSLGSIRFGTWSGYDNIGEQERGLVEVPGVYENQRYSNPLHEMPRGMSKVQEEIWKLKNKKV